MHPLCVSTPASGPSHSQARANRLYLLHIHTELLLERALYIMTDMHRRWSLTTTQKRAPAFCSCYESSEYIFRQCPNMRAQRARYTWLVVYTFTKALSVIK